MKKVKCPFCGYLMPINYTETAIAKGVWVRCKGRNCHREFEVVIPPKEVEKKQ